MLLKHIAFVKDMVIMKKQNLVVSGFSSAVPACDKFTIFRLSGIQISILVAAFNLYDTNTNSFSRNFYEQKLEPQDPMFDFRNFLLNFATELRSLTLDDIEAAFLVALVAVGTGKQLQRPSRFDFFMRGS